MPRAAGGRGVVRRIRRAGLVALAVLGRRHLCTMRAVGGEDTMESSQVDSGLGHQCDKPRNEVHRFEYDVSGAIAVRRFELVTHMAITQQRQPLFRHRWASSIRNTVFASTYEHSSVAAKPAR